MGIDVKEKIRTNNKLYTILSFILIGILLLLLATPISGTKKDEANNNLKNTTNNDKEREQKEEEYVYYSQYYEERLKEILETSYGEGTIKVMVHLVEGSNSLSGNMNANNLFSGVSYDTSANGVSEYAVDGVLIVAKVDSDEAIANISYGVCALFDLPAHKCAVLRKIK